MAKNEDWSEMGLIKKEDFIEYFLEKLKKELEVNLIEEDYEQDMFKEARRIASGRYGGE